jgi:outer membrane lipase/esterase
MQRSTGGFPASAYDLAHSQPVRWAVAQRLIGIAIGTARMPGRGVLWPLAALTLGVILGGMPAPTFAGPYSRIFVFGDSLSDTGNLFIMTDEVPFQDTVPVSPPYFEGRFSNRRVWVEQLATRLGHEARAFLDGGTNYAFGGAKAALDTDELFSGALEVFIPSIRSQVSNLFFGKPGSDFPFDDFPFDLPSPFEGADPSALYVVWGGPNDLRPVVQQGGQSTKVAQSSARSLARAIQELAENGAVHFLVANMPDLGQTPESLALGAERRAFATELSEVFNDTLETSLRALEAEFAISISRFDTFKPLRQAVANPAAFGFTNVTDPCLTVPDGDEPSEAPFVGGTPCARPREYLFWDFIHPSAAAHKVLADFAFRALPPMVATAGEQNPDETVTVSGAAQDLPVLQVRLGTTAEPVQITRVTLHFSERRGDASRLESLRVRLIQDTNANGRFDTGEAVLATHTVQNIAAGPTLDLMPPLALDPETTQHLLVTLDINTSTGATRTNQASRAPLHRRSLAALGGFVVLLPALSMVLMSQRPARRVSLAMVLLVLCCGLLLTGCPEDGNGDGDGGERAAFTFTVSLRAQGIAGQTAPSAPLAQPLVPLTGATVEIQ